MLQRWGCLSELGAQAFGGLPVLVLRQVRNGVSSSPSEAKAR